ncbi:MAG: sterol desaturase family protein [Methylococcaceae bacterium]|nr:sterol desaturase family protein [Methylococcaceae bacterium]
METLIRFTAAFGIFFIMIIWEAFSPRRQQQHSRKQRWPVNLGLAAINMALMRVTVGSLAYLSAVTAMDHGYGVLNWLVVPDWMSLVLSLLLLDLAIYAQHIVFHKCPVLWRVHQVHHTDLEFDATTAVRFHPLEIMLSMAYKVVCIVVMGANPLAVIAFEIILNGAATFNHSNVTLPAAVDNMLRWLIITPDMHRIHHSAIASETDSNYGFSISCWDRLFNTYTSEPERSQTTMAIGLSSFREANELGFKALLLMPFKKLRRREGQD